MSALYVLSARKKGQWLPVRGRHLGQFLGAHPEHPDDPGVAEEHDEGGQQEHHQELVPNEHHSVVRADTAIPAVSGEGVGHIVIEQERSRVLKIEKHELS